MSTFTTKNPAGQTVTLTQLAATPRGDGQRLVPAQTQAAPVAIRTTSGGQIAVQTADGTFILHPTGR